MKGFCARAMCDVKLATKKKSLANTRRPGPEQTTTQNNNSHTILQISSPPPAFCGGVYDHLLSYLHTNRAGEKILLLRVTVRGSCIFLTHYTLRAHVRHRTASSG